MRNCSYCPYTEMHVTQLADTYTKPTTGTDSCTGRYCQVEGCTIVDQIDTIEELQSAINQGLTEIQPSYYHEKQQFLHDAGSIIINKDTTIDGGTNGVTIKRLHKMSTIKPTFVIENGAELTLKNITIEARDSGQGSVIVINDGTLILDDGAVLKNNPVGVSTLPTIDVQNGNLIMNDGSKLIGNGGTYGSVIKVTNGKFTINSGEISVNKGTIIEIPDNAADAEVIMNGGEIINNTMSYYSTAPVLVYNGSFVMNGGKIANNTVNDPAKPGMAMCGGILAIGNGHITVNDGEISNNSSQIVGGIGILDIINGDGGSSSITISGGTITDNISIGTKGSLNQPCDVMAGYTNSQVTGGNISSFNGNLETAKALLLLMGEDPNAMTEEEINAVMSEILPQESLTTSPAVSGGIFGNDVSKYVTEGSTEITYTPSDGSALYAVGASAQDVLKDAGAGDTVTIVSGDTLNGVPNGVTVTNNTGKDISINGETVPADETVVIGTPDSITWQTGTDAGYYFDAGTKYGMMRFLFAAEQKDKITEVGIKYSKASDITEEVNASTVSKAENINAFYGDVTGITESDTQGVYAAAYIKTAKGTFWSAPIFCNPNWSNDYSDYTTGGAQ